jgi:hypothetical protein
MGDGEWIRDVLPRCVAGILRRCAVRRGLEYFVNRPLDGGGDGFLDVGRTSLPGCDLADVDLAPPQFARDAREREAAPDEFRSDVC